jgi:flavorubredoxin
MEAMKSFLEPYMSGKRHVINFLDKLQNIDIEMIFPQHGSIIPKDMVENAIETLYSLDVGVWK